MAAQCWLNNTAPTYLHHQQINQQPQQQQSQPQSQQQTFISSSAYYGYVPAISNNTMSPTTITDNNNYSYNNGAMEMDVEEDGNRQKRLFDNVRDEHCVMKARKRCLVQDDVPGFLNTFKRFREDDFAFRGGGNKRVFNGTGEQWLSTSAAASSGSSEPKYYGLAQMYHEPLLRLSPAADFDCRRISCNEPATITMTGNLLFQPAKDTSSNELEEDMLLFTHGCSSYHHHYRHSQTTTTSNDCSFEEAEF